MKPHEKRMKMYLLSCLIIGPWHPAGLSWPLALVQQTLLLSVLFFMSSSPFSVWPVFLNAFACRLNGFFILRGATRLTAFLDFQSFALSISQTSGIWLTVVFFCLGTFFIVSNFPLFIDCGFSVSRWTIIVLKTIRII